MTEPVAPAASPADLRFDRVEPAADGPETATCGGCGEPLAAAYFEVGGQMICPGCRDGLVAATERGTPVGRLARSLGAGLVAAAIGAGIYYAVLALTGYEVGLIAIVVGFLVGNAVRWGSHGRGGWLYQTLAVGLTYVAIVSTYVPFLFESIAKEGPETAQSSATDTPADDVAASAPALASADLEASAPAAAPAAAVASAATAPAVVVADNAQEAGPAATSDAGAAKPPIGFGQAVLGLLVFGGVVLALPFLGGLDNLIGLLIIGFALYEAWKLNRKRQLVVSGPFAISARPVAAALAVTPDAG